MSHLLFFCWKEVHGYLVESHVDIYIYIYMDL